MCCYNRNKEKYAEVVFSFNSKQIDKLIYEETILKLFSGYGCNLWDVKFEEFHIDESHQIYKGFGFARYRLNINSGVMAAKIVLHALRNVMFNEICLQTDISVTLETILRKRPELSTPYIPEGLTEEPIYSSGRKQKVYAERLNLDEILLPFMSLVDESVQLLSEGGGVPTPINGQHDRFLSPHLAPLHEDSQCQGCSLTCISVRLQNQDQAIRLKTVQLLSRIFSSSNIPVPGKLLSTLVALMGHWCDSSSAVRNEVIHCIERIWIREQNVILTLIDCMLPLLHNSSGSSTMELSTALDVLISIGLACSPLILPVACFASIGQLVATHNDSDIRTAALTGLCKMYAEYVSSQLPKLGDLIASKVCEWVQPDILERLGSVPVMVIREWETSTASTHRGFVLTLIQEHMMTVPVSTTFEVDYVFTDVPPHYQFEDEDRLSSRPLQTRDETRATALFLLFELLGEQERAIFSTILEFKNSVRYALNGLLRARHTAIAAGMKRCSLGTDSLVKTRMDELSTLLPVESKEFYCDLMESWEVIVFENLEAFVHDPDSLDALMIVRSRKELADCMYPKLHNRKFAALLSDVVCMQLIVNRDSVVALQNFSEKHLNGQGVCLELLNVLREKQVLLSIENNNATTTSSGTTKTTTKRNADTDLLNGREKKKKTRSSAK